MDPYSGYSGGGGVGGYPGGGNNNSPYAMTIKIADGVLLFVVAGIFSSDEPSRTGTNIPHLPPAGHRARVVPTGNVDLADPAHDGGGVPSAKPARHDPAAREEVAMVQPYGESKAAGDSEHDARMHIPHGTKEQEEEEEKLKNNESSHTNIPHLPSGGQRSRVNPTGDMKDPADREEVVMVQPYGESKPAGDSEHDTRMHIPHGTKQQEEEEEELKRMMAK
ncbi:hypothetical protein JCM3774_000107 [Rhodotorula dairenensis]